MVRWVSKAVRVILAAVSVLIVVVRSADATAHASRCLDSYGTDRGAGPTIIFSLCKADEPVVPPDDCEHFVRLVSLP